MNSVTLSAFFHLRNNNRLSLQHPCPQSCDRINCCNSHSFGLHNKSLHELQIIQNSSPKPPHKITSQGHIYHFLFWTKKAFNSSDTNYPNWSVKHFFYLPYSTKPKQTFYNRVLNYGPPDLPCMLQQEHTKVTEMIQTLIEFATPSKPAERN